MARDAKRQPCVRCGGQKAVDKNGRVISCYCEECKRAVWIEMDRKRRLCDSKSEDHHTWYCQECAAIAQEKRSEAARAGARTRRTRNPHRARPATAELFWQQYAMRMVSAAKRQGILPSLDGSIACADCGAPAKVYEHRDYARPLDVEPVCQSCNSKRGTAVWPSAEQFRFKRIKQSKHKTS